MKKRVMKILILGGNGFIGKNLCQYLDVKGYEIISFDVTEPGEKYGNIRYIIGNFFKDGDILPYLKDIDIVFHAICTINPGNSNIKYMQGYMYDFLQTVKLCDWSLKYGFKLIYLSSGGTVYGFQETMPIREETLSVPINHYGNLKLCVENTIRTFNKQLGTKNVIARVANPYGPGQDYKKGVGFIDAALKRAIKGEVIEVWGDGFIVRDYIYIEDVCCLLEALIHYDGSETVFNISSNTGMSQNDILKLICQIIPDIQIDYLPARSVDVPTIVLDNSKIMNICSCSCITVEEGIKKYYDYISKVI